MSEIRSSYFDFSRFRSGFFTLGDKTRLHSQFDGPCEITDFSGFARAFLVEKR